MLDENHTRKVRDAFLLGILVCIALVLISLTIRTTNEARVLSEQVAESEQRLRELVAAKGELLSTETELREQPVQDRNAVRDFLQQCRSAEDIPNFQGEQVIAYNDGERLTFYVPDGLHRLEISAEPWLGDEPEKGKTWVVPCPGNTGYVFEVLTDRVAQSLSWELSANDPEFKSREETIVLGDVKRAGGPVLSYSSTLYTNQSHRWRSDQITLWEESAKSPRLDLFYGSWDNKTATDGATKIKVSATLISPGPAHVTASDAVKSIGLQRLDLLMPYKGGGKYELRAPK